MFLLTLCVCVSVYVCVRELLLFPNFASPLSLPQVTLYSQSVGKPTRPLLAHPWTDWDTQLVPPRYILNHLEDGVTMCPPACPTLGAHTYPGKCETSGLCLCQPSLASVVTGHKPQPDLPACLPLSALGGHKTGRHEIKLQLQAPVCPLVSFWDPDLSLLSGASPGWGQGRLFSSPVLLLCHLDEKHRSKA